MIYTLIFDFICFITTFIATLLVNIEGMYKSTIRGNDIIATMVTSTCGYWVTVLSYMEYIFYQ